MPLKRLANKPKKSSSEQGPTSAQQPEASSVKRSGRVLSFDDRTALLQRFSQEELDWMMSNEETTIGHMMDVALASTKKGPMIICDLESDVTMTELSLDDDDDCPESERR